MVAGMGAGFRRCYNRGLTNDPFMAGSVTLEAKIGPNGEVVSSKPLHVKGASGTVAACMAAVVNSRVFASPEGGAATITIPVKLLLK
jgi:hypothetical protein